ncbi:Anoctamin [Operophtera brumata]|uniref:Anoctamin n=1 Tax=Operophtera brumata TaxID=104452 RepID=A0A0L7KWC4_OPEBR|nr:Anoctamin [Operophtera brumata]
MRLDAKKFLTCYRRPVPQRGFIIAFTSEFIPRLVYQFAHQGSLDKYVDHTLADFNITVLDQYKPLNSTYNLTMCRYVAVCALFSE